MCSFSRRMLSACCLRSPGSRQSRRCITFYRDIQRSSPELRRDWAASLCRNFRPASALHFCRSRPRSMPRCWANDCAQHDAQCWLVNTGWTGGVFGVGKRMSLKHTRAMVHAALDGRLANAEFVTEDAFGLSIPTACPDVPSELLHPRNAWADKQAYDRAGAAAGSEVRGELSQVRCAGECSRRRP